MKDVKVTEEEQGNGSGISALPFRIIHAKERACG